MHCNPSLWLPNPINHHPKSSSSWCTHHYFANAFITATLSRVTTFSSAECSIKRPSLAISVFSRQVWLHGTVHYLWLSTWTCHHHHLSLACTSTHKLWTWSRCTDSYSHWLTGITTKLNGIHYYHYCLELSAFLCQRCTVTGDLSTAAEDSTVQDILRRGCWYLSRVTVNMWLSFVC